MRKATKEQRAQTAMTSIKRLDLEKNKKNKEVVQAIYADMLKPDWVTRTGKK